MRRKPINYAALAALLAGVCIAPVAASGVAKADSEANVTDLGGYEVVIGDWWSDPDAAPANAAEQALKEYRKEMMEKYNFTIVQKAICRWGDQQSSFVDGTQAGDPIAYSLYDIAMNGSNSYAWYVEKNASEIVENMKGSWDSYISDANNAYTPAPDSGEDYILPIEYNMNTGSDSEWSEDSNEGLLFVSNAEFDKFKCVKVDGDVVYVDNYTAESGSTRITLKPAYLKTLAGGTHTITIVSKNGSASANFTIKTGAPVSPTTGAPAGLGLTCALLAVLSAMTGIVVEKRKKK